MNDFINSTINTKIYNLMSDEHQIITITDKEAVVENIGTIVSGDTNSCLLTFEINRFQDGIDLSDKKIRFNYRNSNGKFYDIAVNVKYNDDVIRFSWLLPYSLTQPGGNVIASIEFYGFIEYDEEYSYKTKNFKLSVEKSIGVDDGSDESYNNWAIKIENNVESIQNKIIEIEKYVKSINVPTKLSEMDDDADHRTVTDSQIQVWNEAQNTEKSAEAWAHGDHENYPERDEDNAKYYAEQAARIAAGIGNGGSGSISEDVIRQIISDFLQTNPPEEKDPTVSEWAKKDLGAGLTISEDGKLIVDTTDTVEEDNTKPVTSGAVYVVLGNVETLLSIL